MKTKTLTPVWLHGVDARRRAAHIDKNGQDMPELRDWKWNVSVTAAIPGQP